MKSFGEQLNYYRDVSLNMTQTAFAQEVSKHDIYQIDARQIEAWEQNRELEKLSDPIFALLVGTIERLGRTLKHWDDTQVERMEKELASALVQWRKDHSYPLGDILLQYRESLEISAERFTHETEVHSTPDREYLRQVESGTSAPSQAFVLASHELLADGPPDLKPAFARMSQKSADFIVQGMNPDLQKTHADRINNIKQQGQLFKEIRLLFSEGPTAISTPEFTRLLGIERKRYDRLETNTTLNTGQDIFDIIRNKFREKMSGTSEFGSKTERLEIILRALQSKIFSSANPLTDAQLAEQYGMSPTTHLRGGGR